MPEHGWDNIVQDNTTKGNVQDLLISIIKIMIAADNSPELYMNIFNIIPDLITHCTSSVSYDVTMQTYAKVKKQVEIYKNMVIDPEDRILFATTNGVYCLARLGMQGLVFPFLEFAQCLCDIFEKSLNQGGSLSANVSVCMGIMLDKGNVEAVKEETKGLLDKMMIILLDEPLAPEITAAYKYVQ